MKENAIHYVASQEPLGTVLHDVNSDKSITCSNVSAGHPKHEYTTGTSWPSIAE